VNAAFAESVVEVRPVTEYAVAGYGFRVLVLNVVSAFGVNPQDPFVPVTGAYKAHVQSAFEQPAAQAVAPVVMRPIQSELITLPVALRLPSVFSYKYQ
jgi:hypothetical protein